MNSDEQKTSQETSLLTFMRRGEIFLEDKEWAQASTYFEKVLDIDPEYGQAYAGKLCAEYKAATRGELAKADRPLDESKNYKNALQFGDTALQQELSALNTETHNALTYQRAVKAYNAKEFQTAQSLFQSIAGYKDASDLAEKSGQMGVASSDHKKRALEMRQKVTTYKGNAIICNKDGTLTFVMQKLTYETEMNVLDKMSQWTDLIAVSGLFGLHSDGTVVSVDRLTEPHKWNNIVAISGDIALKSDGTVITNNIQLKDIVKHWTDIVAISGGNNFAAGLTSKGEIMYARPMVARTSRAIPSTVPTFPDAVAIHMTEWHVMVLRSDGTVWASDFHVEGNGFTVLQSLGKDRATSVTKDSNGKEHRIYKLDVAKWNDIISIGGVRNVGFGIKSDGRMVIADSSSYYQDHLKPQALGMRDIVAADLDITPIKPVLFGFQDLSGGVMLHNDILPQYILRTPQYFEERRNLRRERAEKGLCIYCGGTLTGLFTKKCRKCGRDNDGGLLDELDKKLGNR